MQGLVIKNTGFWYTVLTDDGATIDCKVKGNFRLKGIRSTNPVAVGDRVTIDETGSLPAKGKKKPLAPSGSLPTGFRPPRNGGNEGGVKTIDGGGRGYWITAIEDRKNYIIRKSSNLSKQSHILAANLDQAMLIVTINYPETSTTFIDRFLASAEAYRIPVVLVFNKIDLLAEEELHYLEMMRTLYSTIGYDSVAVSATDGTGMDELRQKLNGKITLFSGNSGVGKSTIINSLIPGANLRTAEISDAHNQGTHTTTFSEMLPLPETDTLDANKLTEEITSPAPNTRHTVSNAWIIDTPGIRGFGTFDMEKEELTSYFKEIFRFSKDCRFSDCSHTHEPGCAVLEAVENHYIAASRYQSYLSMLEDKEDGKYRAAY